MTTVTFIAKDNCGNIEMCTADFEITVDTILPTASNAIFCSSNKGNGASPIRSTNFGSSTLMVDCNSICASSTTSWYENATGGSPLFDNDSDADGINDADLDGNATTFDPVNAGLVDADEPGTYTFYAECSCSAGSICTSERIPVTLTILDCEIEDNECTYLLVLEDTGNDGWD